VRPSNSFSEDQREAAVAWFEKGIADKATASLLGVARSPVNRLYRRWRIHGREVLMTKPTKRAYSFKFKLALVERFAAARLTGSRLRSRLITALVLLCTPLGCLPGRPHRRRM
jgi:hypothetical protein